MTGTVSYQPIDASGSHSVVDYRVSWTFKIGELDTERVPEGMRMR